MNILILQASPRGKGNTAWMAEEYKKAAEAAGHQVTLFDVSHKKIAGCLACEYCHGKSNGACVQKDDMQELYPLMAEAEALVLAVPIYYFTLCAQMQAPIQRMYCVNAPAKVKKMAMLLSSYSPGVYDGCHDGISRHLPILESDGHGHRNRQDRRAENGGDEEED